jgi:diguanylate cyclase (GGDEF)-like protein
VPERDDTPLSESIRLLLIEGDAIEAAFLCETLSNARDAALEIDPALTLDDGLRRLEQTSYQVVILDLTLEAGDGLDSLARLRAAAGPTPIVVLTREGDPAQVSGALRVGAQDYLVQGEREPRLIERTVLYAAERHRLQADLAVARQREHYAATHDPLTGLPNRASFLGQLGHSMAYAARTQNQAALLLLGLDRFKKVNDSIGHELGDQLLQTLARRLRGLIRRSDVLARLGSDEFIILLHDVQRDHDPARVAQKLLDSFAEPFSLGGQDYRITASVGIAVYPGDGLDAKVLMKNADVAMHHAKQAGSDHYSHYTREMDDAVAHSLDLESGLREALEVGALRVHYQPQVHLTKGLIGAEALVRWNSPSHGNISPAEFIPMAEETGLIHPLGAYVLRTACAHAANWEGAGRGVKVGVNVSTRQLATPDFARTVSQVLRETGLDPCRLELEITESGVLQEGGATLATIRLVRQLGVRVTIDDFGTGYSALSALRYLPVDGIKIDRSFVSDLGRDAAVGTITSSLIDLAYGLGLRTTAEGVETSLQQKFLERKGSPDMQGFLFSRPLPADEFESHLLEERPPWYEALSALAA